MTVSMFGPWAVMIQSLFSHAYTCELLYLINFYSKNTYETYCKKFGLSDDTTAAILIGMPTTVCCSLYNLAKSLVFLFVQFRRNPCMHVHYIRTYRNTYNVSSISCDPGLSGCFLTNTDLVRTQYDGNRRPMVDFKQLVRHKC